MSYTEGTNYHTEFAGTYELLWVDVSPDSASGNITIGEWDNAIPVGGLAFIEALASTCINGTAIANSTTTNQIDIVLYNASGGAATTFPDFKLLVLVYND